jgi:hypothetical protein
MTNHFSAADSTEQDTVRDLVVGHDIRPLSAHPADPEDGDDLEVDDEDEAEDDESDEDLLEDDENDEDEDDEEDEIKDEDEE